MKYAFIGCGNMAGAILGGMLKTGIAKPEEIICSAPSEATRARAAAEFGVAVTADNSEAASGAEVVFLCVKPQIFPETADELSKAIPEDALIISIIGGRTITDLEKALTPGGAYEADEDEDEDDEEAAYVTTRKIVRVMPNTPALVGEGMSALAANENVSEAELDQALAIFRALGQAEMVPERLFDAVTAVSGSSPAYVFLFLEAMADGAVLEGMPRQQAYRFAAQSVLGSAKLMMETGKHPGELKDMVCSPGGTTAEAVRVLEKKGFRGAVLEAVHTCAKKSRKL